MRNWDFSRSKVLIINLFFLAAASGWLIGESLKDETAISAYLVTVSEDQVYDGDTIQRVRVKIKKLENENYPAQKLWPGIFLEGDQILVETNLRLAGVDSPEMHPKKAGRSEESLAKEKAAAAESRQALVDLLVEYGYQMTVVNPKLGKYAGRVVGEVFIGGIDVADYMIENGHAVEYDGGTKTDWGF